MRACDVMTRSVVTTTPATLVKDTDRLVGIIQGSVTITDQHTDPADHHVALVLAQAVPGVTHAEVVHSTSQRA